MEPKQNHKVLENKKYVDDHKLMIVMIKIVAESQKIIKSNEDASSVSLRDIARYKKFYK